MSNNPPKRHHYIPKFYLKRWKNKDGTIGQISSDKCQANVKLVHPKETGFEWQLYTLRGFSDDSAQVVEKNFFSEVDDKASNVIDLLDSRKLNISKLSIEQRLAWSRFLVSLLLRCPEDIASLRNWWPLEWEHAVRLTQLEFTATNQDFDTISLDRILSGYTNEWRELRQFVALSNLIQFSKPVDFISRMHWHVVDLTYSSPDLLTSDRPVIWTRNLNNSNGHIAIPLSPTQLFLATTDLNYLERLKSARQRSVVLECNRLVVGAAMKYVYRRVETIHEDDLSKNFIPKWFGVRRNSGLMDEVVSHRSKKIARLLTE